MSQENVEIVRQFFEGFNWYASPSADSGEPLWGSLHPDIEVLDHDILDAGTYRGHDGFVRWLEDWDEPWEAWSMEAERWIDAGDQVVLIFRMTAKGRGSGVEMTRQDGMVWAVRDGQVIRIDYYNSEAQTLEAVGLS
jgi:ketosteroid isomerase-like protein